jgi:hypothetical protein
MITNWSAIGYKTRSEIRNKVGNHVWDQVHDQVFNDIWNTTRYQPVNIVRTQISNTIIHSLGNPN